MIIDMPDRASAVVGVAVVVALAGAGCGGGGSTAAPATSTSVGSPSAGPNAGSGSPSATPSPSPSPTATSLTAHQMTAALLRRSAVPAGYQLRIKQGIHPTTALGCGHSGIRPAREVGDDYQKGMTGAEIREAMLGYPSVAAARRAMARIVAFVKVCRLLPGGYHLHPISFPAAGDQLVATSVVYRPTGFGFVAGRGQLTYVLNGAEIVQLIVLGSQAAKAAPSGPLVRAAVAGIG